MKIDSQKYMGKNQLVERLASQVGSMKLAVDILIKRGDLTADGKRFTEKGAERNAMTAEERAIDRASKKSKHDPSEYKYNKLTNLATLKNKKNGG
jgi:hypothetical protein